MTYAYSQIPLINAIDRKVTGNMRFLEKSLFEISSERAVKAVIELAMYLRMLDEDSKITEYFKETNNQIQCGTLYKKKDNSTEVIFFRDFTNKVIHAERIEWKFDTNIDPMFICYAYETSRENWSRAEIDIFAVALMCGQIGH